MNPLPNEMYPRHENMNPDVGNRHLWYGFRYSVPDSFYEEADSCILCWTRWILHRTKWIRRNGKWIRNPKLWIQHKQWVFSELIHLLWCGIHLTLLRTRFVKQIVSVHEMNPGQQKMNPDAKKEHLRSGFRFISADSLYDNADSLSNNSDSVKSVADSWKTHEYPVWEYESWLKRSICSTLEVSKKGNLPFFLEKVADSW